MLYYKLKKNLTWFRATQVAIDCYTVVSLVISILVVDHVKSIRGCEYDSIS